MSLLGTQSLQWLKYAQEEHMYWIIQLNHCQKLYDCRLMLFMQMQNKESISLINIWLELNVYLLLLAINQPISVANSEM